MQLKASFWQPASACIRRSRFLAVAAFVTLGLILVLGSTPAHAAQLSVGWSDATPDDHTGFKVERKTTTTGAFAQVATTGPTVMAYLDTTLTAGTTYCYRVRAYNTAGDSAYTPEGCAVAPTPVVRTLTVAKSGTGTGTVDSSPNGITCGGTCSATYISGTTVSLSATPATGATFTGWSGACTGTGGCAVVLDANKSATATFALSAPTTYALSVSKSGTGTGTVTSTPAGINCSTDCTENYNYNTSVTLTATAATGSTFTGWSGACSGTGSCVVSMTAARSVTATFTVGTPTTYTLSLTKGGTGSGTVTSSPTGISCGSTCSASFNSGTSVTLTAVPAANSVFAGWSGTCNGTGTTCTRTMSQNRSVTATFTAQTYTLAVTTTGTGTGTVTSNPAGINCGSNCSASFNSGTSVTLTATAATGSTFTGWGGACAGTGPCTLTMSQVRDVTATFTTGSGLNCPCTVFPATAVPAILADSDTSAVELGMKFRASVPGTITGIRFFKSATNTGTHVGTLWTSTGTRLGTVTFTNETISGWQQATFATPIPISANTTYVVSYHTTVGRYSANNTYFGSAVVTGPLTALASRASSGNGVYRYGAGGFPTQTYNASNYWVDVVFRP